MTPPESVNSFWALVGKLQPAADRRQLDHQSWVADERLDEVLSRSDQSDLLPEELARLNRQARNRAKKYFRRKRLLATYARSRCHQTSQQFAAVETRDATEPVRCHLSKGEWELLMRLAEGVEYQTLADELQIPVGTLKAKASRARQRARGCDSEPAN